MTSNDTHQQTPRIKKIYFLSYKKAAQFSLTTALSVPICQQNKFNSNTYYYKPDLTISYCDYRNITILTLK
jgi:hypothetical protein